MALMRLTAYRGRLGYAYYIGTRKALVQRPHYKAKEAVDPELVLDIVRKKLPVRPYLWTVLYRANVGEGTKYMRYGVRLLRSDQIPEDQREDAVLYPFERAAEVWLSYLQFLNLPKKVKS